jgi:hypothetical protein
MMAVRLLTRGSNEAAMSLVDPELTLPVLFRLVATWRRAGRLRISV